MVCFVFYDERGVEIFFIGFCVVVGIDDERWVVFLGFIFLIGGKVK